MKLMLLLASVWLVAGIAHAQPESAISSRLPSPQALGPGTVLITGGNRGLGLEFARQYAARGWTVIATARNPDEALELRELAIRDGVTIERLDVLDREAIAALAARYEGKPIDLLINNAGIGGDPALQALGSFDYELFEEAMAVNVYGPLAVSEAFLANVAASRHKKIVAITSGWGVFAAAPAGAVFLSREQGRVEHGDACDGDGFARRADRRRSCRAGRCGHCATPAAARQHSGTDGGGVRGCHDQGDRRPDARE